MRRFTNNYLVYNGHFIGALLGPCALAHAALCTCLCTYLDCLHVAPTSEFVFMRSVTTIHIDLLFSVLFKTAYYSTDIAACCCSTYTWYVRTLSCQSFLVVVVSGCHGTTTSSYPSLRLDVCCCCSSDSVFP